MRQLFITFLFFIVSTLAFAQTGTVKGTIKDKNTNEGLVGATVMIEGTTIGSNTDIEGNFAFKAPVGTYNLIISFVSYKTHKITGVKVENEKVLTIQHNLEEDNTNLTEVVVYGIKETNTSVAVINEMKRMDAVAVGVSSEQMSRTLDRDAGQAVKRVPGVSIVDDKFVVVRGLSERYNTVLLNDVITPSSEVDSRAFSFDMIPTGALDKMLVIKSTTAENPGDVAGGVIKLYTKGYSDANSFNVNVTSGYRFGTTFQNALSQKQTVTDFLGFDSHRQLNMSFPRRLGNDARQNAEIAKGLQPYWDASNVSILPDLRLSMNLSRNFFVKNVKVGNITAINYSNTNQFMNIERNLYNNKANDDIKAERIYGYSDASFNNTARLGVMHNWFMLLNPNNRIEFRNLFNQTGITESIVRTGVNDANGFEVKNYNFMYESRSIYSGQLAGYHDLKNEKTKINWTSGFGYTFRNEPDNRRAKTQRVGNSENFTVTFPPTAAVFEAARFYSKLAETNVMLRGDIEHKIKFKGREAKLKAGLYAERKDRVFNARWMSYVKSVNFDNTIGSQPVESIFNNQNNLDGRFGLTFTEGTTPEDAYKANNTLFAGYASANLPLGEKLNANIGLRLEYNDQRILSEKRGGAKVNETKQVLTPMPSLNLTYNLTEKHLLRFAYAYTINRPEFREIAPFGYYRFDYDVFVAGNPNLQNSNIHNVDLRYEWYPNDGEAISVGAFYKNFINPIEVGTIVTGDARTFTPYNAKSATNYGVELDMRKSLGTLTDAPFVKDLSVVANFALINSSVDVSNLGSTFDKSRPMMYQSPYLVNVGLFYNNEASKTQFNLQYNVLGKRLFVVGDVQYPTQYEMPRHLIDLAASKRFGKLEVKAGISDLLNAPFLIKQDSGNRDGKITDSDETIIRLQRGTSVTLGVSYGL